MSMLDDPSMKEIVQDFCAESEQLLTQINTVLEYIEETVLEKKYLEQFGQIIDRIMGAAKSIGADEIGLFCELGKVIAYKASKINDEKLLNVVTAVLFDTIDLLTKMISKIKDGGDHSLDVLDTKTFSTRLKWLSEKFKEIDRKAAEKEAAEMAKFTSLHNPSEMGSAKIGAEKDSNQKDLNQSDIDALMASLGL